MRNKSVSDFVAATMDAVLKSQAHQSLFGGTYKFASDESFANDTICPTHGVKDGCSSDSHSAYDDNDARKKKKDDSEDSSSAFDGAVDEHNASDMEEEDKSCADDSEDLESSALDVAIDSLLTASAALDRAGLEKGSSLSLKLASLVVEAKKKDEKKKSDSKKKSDPKKSSKDSNDARAKKKKEDDKKKSSSSGKKSDSNDARAKKKPSSSSSSSSSKSSGSGSKKPFPFAKKK
jgi:cobalamin biosynthesis Mg chelatase CobN